MGYSNEGPESEMEKNETNRVNTPVKDIDDMDYFDDDICDTCENNRKSVETWYSWFIVLICMVGHVLYYGVSWTVGVYHIIFLEAFQQPAGATSLIGSINTASLYFLAPVGGCLVNRFGCRPLVIVGSLIMAIGLFASFWANNIYVLYLTFGLMAGGGAGIAFIPLITIVSRYFDRRRALAIGLATSGVGLGLLVMPVLITHLKDEFGWRGSLIVLSAILIQFVLFAAFMRPVHLDEDEDVDSLFEIREEKKTFVQCLQLDIFKEKRYLLLCLNNALLMYGISVVYVHMAAYGLEVGVHDSARLFTALGLATYIGRTFFGLIGQWKQLDFVLVYCTALLCAGLPIVLLPHATDLVSMIAIAIIFGLGTSVVGPYLPQLNIIFLGISKMPVGYGYLLIFEGIGTLLGAPSAGTLYDETQIYDYSFYVGGCAIFLSGVVLLPAWRWIEPSRARTEVILEERSQLSLYVNEDELENVPNGKMYGRSHLTLYQSHEALGASLSRMASRQELNHSHSQLSSVLSLHRSHLSMPRGSFSSRLTLHSLQMNGHLHHSPHQPEMAPIVAVGTD